MGQFDATFGFINRIRGCIHHYRRHHLPKALRGDRKNVGQNHGVGNHLKPKPALRLVQRYVMPYIA